MRVPRMTVNWMVLVLTMAVAACSAPVGRDADVVAMIEDEVLRSAELHRFLTVNADLESPLGDSVQSRLFDMFLEQRLLERLARERGAFDSTRVSAADALLALEFETRQVDELAVRTYYETNRSEFEQPARVRLRQILVADEKRVGAPWLRSRRVSPSLRSRPGNRSGPTLGAVETRACSRVTSFRVKLADVIFALEEGEVSELVSADYGHHVFQVVEVLEAQLSPLETVAGEIRDKLFQEHAGELVDGYIAEAKRRYNVRVFAHNLPFAYQGGLQMMNPDSRVPSRMLRLVLVWRARSSPCSSGSLCSPSPRRLLPSL